MAVIEAAIVTFLVWGRDQGSRLLRKGLPGKCVTSMRSPDDLTPQYTIGNLRMNHEDTS